MGAGRLLSRAMRGEGRNPPIAPQLSLMKFHFPKKMGCGGPDERGLAIAPRLNANSLYAARNRLHNAVYISLDHENNTGLYIADENLCFHFCCLRFPTDGSSRRRSEANDHTRDGARGDKILPGESSLTQCPDGSEARKGVC